MEEAQTSLDLYKLTATPGKQGKLLIVPGYDIHTKDYINRNGKAYGVYNPKTGLWIKDDGSSNIIQFIADTMTQDICDYRKELQKSIAAQIEIQGGLPNRPTGSEKDNYFILCKMLDKLPSTYDESKTLDNKIIFSNDEVTRESFATKKLKHAKVEGPIDNYNKLMHSILSDEDIEKAEWCVGALMAGEQCDIQKMLVLYGPPGSGKSSVMDIYQAVVGGDISAGGYCESIKFDDIADPKNRFAVSGYFKLNPLMLRNDDADLSKLDRPEILNQIIQGQPMKADVKGKDMITVYPHALLMMASNRYIKVNGTSGLIRRIIDIETDINTYGGLPNKEWKSTISAIKKFELGAIAWHCEQVYLSNKEKYKYYRTERQLSKSDLVYNYLLDNEERIISDELNNGRILLSTYYGNYKVLAESYNEKPLKFADFREQFGNYCKETGYDKNRGGFYAIGFSITNFLSPKNYISTEDSKAVGLELNCNKSLLDEELAQCQAQYATSDDIPSSAWNEVTTKLSDLNTSKLHYVRVPLNHIVIDFDIKDESGKKCTELNLIEAAKWPATYAELSKGGGVHLHYIYEGDPELLASCTENKDIEIKVFKGKTALRRKLSKCNDIPIATLKDLPYKKKRGKKVIEKFQIEDDNHLRNIILKALKKGDNLGGTKSEMDWIFKNVEDAYKSGVTYNIEDLRPKIVSFAFSSTNHALYCANLAQKMHYSSETEHEGTENYASDKLVIFDCEVFPNVFIVCWKYYGENKKHRMINPTAAEVEKLFSERLVGFNCRDYDNHMLYARGYLNYTNQQLFELSQKLTNPDLSIAEKQSAKFGGAYDLSYTDVMEYYNITEKFKSLKKWEVELGISHIENEYPWDQPLAEEHWEEVTDYCCNDVDATEAVFNATTTEFAVRKMLVKLAKMAGGNAKMNDTTNKLITQIIFEGNKTPQSEFNYRNLAEPCPGKPHFPGYEFKYSQEQKKYVSTYKNIELGEGGLVIAVPGMYSKLALLDISSMHPSSAIAEELFGPYYTKRFQEIKDARIAVKHRDFDKLKTLLNGVIYDIIMEEHMENDKQKLTELAHALKIVINSVYGLTAASFANAFRDPRNKDNIVAKRGALFMVDLKEAVESEGYFVAHIKTDSIKIPNADDYIINFVMEFGKKYGYNFELEAIYDRMCLVNDAVYIAKYKEADGKPCSDWTATGAQFQEPYIFKTLFSKEELTLDDVCTTKSVSGGGTIYMDINADKNDSEPNYKFIGKVGKFLPVKPGFGGGALYRCSVNKETGEKKYASLTGTNGYLFKDATEFMGKDLSEIEHIIDWDGYFKDLLNKAVENMSQYGNVEKFINDPDFYVESKMLPF